MNYRHIEELDHAVRTANHAVDTMAVRREEQLTRYLYQHWYAGPARPPADPSAGPGHTWQAWSPHWTEKTGALGSDLVRLYLSSDPEHAARIVGLVTATAMSWHEPWRFISVTTPGHTQRFDATIVFLPITSLARLRGEVQTLLTRLRPMLRNQTPAFTLRVGHGAALAQNPADGRSFGQHRCSLVARAVLASRGALHREQVHRATYTFAEAGVDPEHPYRENRAGTWDQPWRTC